MDYHKKKGSDYYDDEMMSGWSAYLDEFCSLNDEEGGVAVDGDNCSSLVSDAAWNGFMTESSSVKKSKNLNSKKNRRRMTISDKGFRDDDLQDTASSPADSPKVSTKVNNKNKNKQRMDDSYSRRRDDHHNEGLYMENGESCAKVGEEGDIGKNKEDIDVENDYNDLEKRGLCLVDVSTFINSYMR